MNPAFAIGQQVGTNFAQAREKQQDISMLDKILADSMATNDPNVLQNNIGQILKTVSPARQPQAIKLIESRINSIAENRQRQAKKEAGFPEYLPDQLAALKYKEDEKNAELVKYGIKSTEPKPKSSVQQPQLQNGIEPIQQQQPSVPGMQLSQDTGQTPSQPIQKIIEQQEPEQISDEERLKNPSLWTQEDLVKAQGSPHIEIRNTANAEDQRRSERKKEIARSYGGINEKFINKTYDQFELTQRKDALLDRMKQLRESNQLSDSGIINLLQQLGFKEEWLQNPFNEEYNKLGLDLLGGGTLQEDYGSRVLASEFKVSQQRIPTLSQTPEGRAQIEENMRVLTLPSKLKYERMQYYLEKADRTGEPLPNDLRGKILRNIKPQLDEAYDKFKQRNGRYQVKQGTPLDQNAKEKYFYLSEGNVEKAKKMMKEDGYDVP